MQAALAHMLERDYPRYYEQLNKPSPSWGGLGNIKFLFRFLIQARYKTFKLDQGTLMFCERTRFITVAWLALLFGQVILGFFIDR